MSPFRDIAVPLPFFPLEVKGVKMKRTLQVLAVILLIAGVDACSPKMPPTQVSISTVQPTLAESYHPLTARTGIKEIDRVLDAIGEIQRLRSLIQLTATRCPGRTVWADRQSAFRRRARGRLSRCFRFSALKAISSEARRLTIGRVLILLASMRFIRCLQVPTLMKIIRPGSMPSCL